MKQWRIWVSDLHDFSNCKNVEVQAQFPLAGIQLGVPAFDIAATKGVTQLGSKNVGAFRGYGLTGKRALSVHLPSWASCL